LARVQGGLGSTSSMVRLNSVEYKPISARDILVELKDTSELMVDLAYSAALFHSQALAEVVMELESHVDDLIYFLEMDLMLAARNAEDAEALVGLSKVGTSVDTISNAAADIALLVLKDVGIHPIVRDAFRRVEERVVRAVVKPGSSIVGKRVGELDPWVEVIAVRRDGRWIIYPEDGEVVEAGDVLIARGAPEEVGELVELAERRPEVAPTVEIPSKHFQAIADKLVELKDTSEFMVDLAYSSLLLNSRELAEEVMRLEDYVDDLHQEFELLVLSSGFSPADAKNFLGLIRLGVVTEEIADAAAEIAEVVLRGLKPHPVIRLVIRESEERVTRVQVSKNSKLVGVRLREARIPEETGMWILAIRRGKRLIRPKPDTRIKAGDILIACGYAEGEAELKALASPTGG